MTVLAWVLRTLDVVGVLLAAGAFARWALYRPSGRSDRRAVLLAQSGLLLVALAAAATALLPWMVGRDGLGEALGRPEAAWGLVRLAVVAGVAGFCTDLLARDTRGWRAVALGGAAAAMVLTLAAPVVPARGPQTALLVAGALAVAVVGPGGLVVWAVSRPSRAVPSR